ILTSHPPPNAANGGFLTNEGFTRYACDRGGRRIAQGESHGSTACEPRSYSPAAWLPTAPPERTALSGCSPGNQVWTACRRDEPSGRLMPLAYATGHAARAAWGNAFSAGDARLQ